MSLPGSVPYSLVIPFFVEQLVPSNHVVNSLSECTAEAFHERESHPWVAFLQESDQQQQQQQHHQQQHKPATTTTTTTSTTTTRTTATTTTTTGIFHRWFVVMLIMRVSLEVNQKYQRTHAHRIHGTGTGIFTYIYHQHQVNICSVNIHGLYAMDLPRGCWWSGKWC